LVTVDDACSFRIILCFERTPLDFIFVQDFRQSVERLLLGCSAVHQHLFLVRFRYFFIYPDGCIGHAGYSLDDFGIRHVRRNEVIGNPELTSPQGHGACDEDLRELWDNACSLLDQVFTFGEVDQDATILGTQIPKIVTIDAFTRQEPRDFPQFDSPLEFPTL
jgi:hypothetical protein